MKLGNSSSCKFPGLCFIEEFDCISQNCNTKVCICPKSLENSKSALVCYSDELRGLVCNMAIGVVEFSREGYKIRKVFA